MTRFEWLVAKLHSLVKTHPHDYVLVLSGVGYGDKMRAAACARALHLAGYGKVIFTTTVTGTSIEWSIAAACPWLAGFVAHQPMPTRGMLARLLKQWGYVLDATSMVPILWDRRGRPVASSMPYLGLSLGDPYSRYMLRALGETQFEAASASLGVPVTPDLMPVLDKPPVRPRKDDLPPPLTSIRPENWGKATPLKIPKGKKYIVVSFASGMLSAVKSLPQSCIKVVLDCAKERGVEVVHIGARDVPKLDGTIDARGLRMDAVVKLMKGALGVVSVEGFASYVARSTSCRCLTLMGPTPYPFFAIEGNVHSMATPGGRLPCPIGTCFWSWAYGLPPDHWGMTCRVALANGKRTTDCANYVPAAIKDAVSKFLDGDTK